MDISKQLQFLNNLKNAVILLNTPIQVKQIKTYTKTTKLGNKYKKTGTYTTWKN